MFSHALKRERLDRPNLSLFSRRCRVCFKEEESLPESQLVTQVAFQIVKQGSKPFVDRTGRDGRDFCEARIERASCVVGVVGPSLARRSRTHELRKLSAFVRNIVRTRGYGVGKEREVRRSSGNAP